MFVLIDNPMRLRKDVQAVLKNGNEFLIVKKNNREWRLLKGGVEEEETDKEALKREIKEEVGVSNVDIRGKIHSYEYKAEGVHHKVSSYLVETNQRGLEIFERELKDAEWVTIKELLEMLEYENERKVVRRALEILNKSI